MLSRKFKDPLYTPFELEQPLLIPNFLDTATFLTLKEACRKWVYIQTPCSHNQYFMLSKVRQALVDDIKYAIRSKVHESLRPIVTFARLNTSDLDTFTRIHSDGHINGVKPAAAMVLYTETSNQYGTAFFEHPEHGKHCISNTADNVFTSSKGWEIYSFVPARENTALFYPSNLFHSRYPFKAYGTTRKDGRIVIVSFLEETR